jgi:hypothetical protein
MVGGPALFVLWGFSHVGLLAASDRHWIHSLFPVYLLHQRSDLVQHTKPEVEALVAALRESVPSSELALAVGAAVGLPASLVQEML